jgi:hypothetical protein
MAVLDQIREQRGVPQFLRMDNGPEFIADTLRDWCKEQNIQANYCDPGSLWQNGRIESFNSRLIDELLTREVLDSMWEIRFMLEEHRNNYNHYQPHSALAYLTPIKHVDRKQCVNHIGGGPTNGVQDKCLDQPQLRHRNFDLKLTQVAPMREQRCGLLRCRRT